MKSPIKCMCSLSSGCTTRTYTRSLCGLFDFLCRGHRIKCACSVLRRTWPCSRVSASTIFADSSWSDAGELYSLHWSHVKCRFSAYTCTRARVAVRLCAPIRWNCLIGDIDSTSCAAFCLRVLSTGVQTLISRFQWHPLIVPRC